VQTVTTTVTIRHRVVGVMSTMRNSTAGGVTYTNGKTQRCMTPVHFLDLFRLALHFLTCQDAV